MVWFLVSTNKLTICCCLLSLSRLSRRTSCEIEGRLFSSLDEAGIQLSANKMKVCCCCEGIDLFFHLWSTESMTLCRHSPRRLPLKWWWMFGRQSHFWSTWDFSWSPWRGSCGWRFGSPYQASAWGISQCPMRSSLREQNVTRLFIIGVMGLPQAH